MNTDDLIATLGSDVPPVKRSAVGRRLVLGIAAGAAVSASYVLLMWGARPDLAVAMHGFYFWMKWAYTISLAFGALALTAQLARPETHRLRWLWLLAIPVLLLASVGVFELLHTPQTQWLAMWLGQSWKQCPWRVLSLAMPIFIGLLWSFRRLAPTRLRLAGAAAGLAAGAFAATVYCLHCPEASAIFVLTWYSLGILLAASFGALVGPRLLRW
ncbi:DUF1109 domain-containing protein [Sphingomonas sp. 10B4]|uniref:DUF1109 domain-containing protein n=1 Tax=Sphingomonas sp. 10B4 TaxID=3048575 RepID=UPI002AB33955|nr:DUF1109 domain-containing protein [Sphingomonas sp. 10B4]MDY7525195.1 DUF1109 domain-containing protein [Sphingomonas sp. 10B4]MEB0282019.1 DUF1109 domain-containing protein [Sphingomonas sp. 10B4]